MGNKKSQRRWNENVPVARAMNHRLTQASRCHSIPSFECAIAFSLRVFPLSAYYSYKQTLKDLQYCSSPFKLSHRSYAYTLSLSHSSSSPFSTLPKLNITICKFIQISIAFEIIFKLFSVLSHVIIAKKCFPQFLPTLNK